MTNQYLDDFSYRNSQPVRMIDHPRDIVAPATRIESGKTVYQLKPEYRTQCGDASEGATNDKP